VDDGGPHGGVRAGDPPAPVAPAPRRPALSPSRAVDFRRCPLLYRFRAVDRLPEPPDPVRLRGTLVHTVLEHLYDLPAATRTPPAARALLEPAWAQLRAGLAAAGTPPFGAADAAAEAAWLTTAGDLVEAYFRLEDPRRLTPAARELRVETELASGVPLRGYLDRLDVAPNGALRVVDYKTGSSPGASGEARALFPMKFYALAVLLDRGVVPLLVLLYLADGAALSYRPDAAELRRFARLLDAVWAAILAAAPTGDFRPSPGPHCRWCDHRELCPEWGGTPPPYPGWPG
jgi:putative RecB family exonuclease